MTAKRYVSYLYGDHLENVSHIQLLFYHYLSGLQVNTSPKTQFNDCCVAILFLPAKKIPQGCQADITILLIPTQEVSKMTNQS